MKKKILFRADGNAEIGLGHLYRLFALVEIYKDYYDFTFLTNEKSSISIIPEEYNVIIIPELTSIEDEPKWISENLPAIEYMIIADGYQFVSSYQKKLKELDYFIVYIDDLIKEYMYADVVVNHSLEVSAKSYKSETYTQFALGTNYSMLRPLFLKKVNSLKKVKSVDTIFVCFGGADFDNITYRTCKILLTFDFIKEINVVLGGAYKHKEIYDLVQSDNKIVLHKNLNEKKMILLMEKCNIAISPASTISYELSCIGIPLICGYYVENQLSIYKGFVENDLVYGIGDFRKISELKYKEFLTHILGLSVAKHNEKIKKQRSFFNKNQKANFLSLLEII